MTKITIEDKYGKYQIEDADDDLDIHRMMDLFGRTLLAQSFFYETVRDGFIEKGLSYDN